MSTHAVRCIANGTITVFSLLLIITRMTSLSSSGYHLLWGIPALLILVLDIYFLTKSMLHQPKGIDTTLSSFLLSVGASLGFGFSAIAIAYPASDLAYSSVLRELGSVIAVLPYPFIIWALFCLKDCLTVIPEAHGVVARGIYKYSRHPLYVCFIVWATANMMMFPSWAMITVSVAHIILLLLRLKREERLLLATFSEYRTYYQRTGLIGNLRLGFLLGE
ncbi:MAG: isoprenylcysteine carboxylmethyltransferase family protein [Negativicutes bacterium]|nr:isoprenylcysteine carboxylmethyltransferase family protein [Negativicutes bacterium]